MRIPVRAQLNGYTPALNPFSKDKLVWVKIDTTADDIGIPGQIGLVAAAISAFAGARWSYSFYGKQENFNVYQELGHDKFVFLFILAALVGILSYIWGLFVYDFKKTKDYSLSKSIELYKKTSKRSKERLEQLGNYRWWIIPVIVISLGFSFQGLFTNSSNWRLSGILLGLMLVVFAYFAYAILFLITRYYSRRYLNRKFNIKFNDKSPLPKKKGK